MKNTLIALVLTSVCFTASAQVTISPVAGSEVSNYANYYYRDFYVIPGLCAGALVDVPAKRKWSLQTGLLYKRNIYRTLIYDVYGSHSAGDFAESRVSFLELPVKVTWSMPVLKKHQFFIGAGPYVGMNLAASSHVRAHYYDNNSGNVGIADEENKLTIGGPTQMHRMEVGAGLNAGFRASWGLLVCLQGQAGLNLNGALDGMIDHYNFGIVAGYTFKLKKHKTPAEPAQPK